MRRGRRYDTRHTPDEPIAESTAPVVADIDAAPEEAPVDAEQLEEEEAPRRSKHSRPPAPAFALGARSALAEEAELAESGEVEAPEEEMVGTELDLESEEEEEEAATSTERLVSRAAEPESERPASELPLGERETMPAVPGKFGPDTPRDAGWLRSTPASEDVARDEQESFPPVVEELEDRADDEGPSEEQLRRRGRLRRFVAVAVVAAGAVTVGLVAFASLSPEVSYAQRQGVASAARVTQRAAADARVKARNQAKQVEAPPAVVSETDALGDDFDAISKETVRLLNAREFEKATGLARRLIELKPTSSFGYRCLGSALQDLGRDAEAREVYSACATHATKGEVYECSALGGRKLPAK